MGLHQKIVSQTESEPCDCGEDDDHSGSVVYTLADSEDQLVDYDDVEESTALALAEFYDEEPVDTEPLEEEGEGKGFTTTEDRLH